MSLAAYQTRESKCQEFLVRAEDLEANLTLQADLVNIRALKDQLLTYILGFPYQGFLVPLTYLDGVHVEIERLISYMVFETPEDYENLLSRYDKLPLQLSQIQELMEEGVSQGIVNHETSMVGVSESLGRFVVEAAEESPLWAPLETFPEDFTQEQITDFQDRGRTIITSQVSPAFQQLRDYVDEGYVTRPEQAITTIPNGEGLYSQLIRFYTTTSLPATEIHQLGIEEVSRIEGEMAKIVAELGYNMSVPEFSAMIKNDSRFFYDDPEELLQGFQHLVYNVTTPRLPEFFINIPKAELKVVADPSPDGVGAYYMGGSIDGSRPGVFYVNTYNVNAQPKYGMVTLSLHEGNPGHHLENSHSIESPTTPYFRRVSEDRLYSQAPSRFPLYSAYSEGWGLYAEKLGFDMNLYEDLYDRYGHYSEEVFRASRLVVDTGLHVLGWTWQEAVDYMFRHTALELKDVENEINRYITWPGQALAYKIGNLKFVELRERAASSLGDTFDIKEFHQVVLEAVGPLDLLEDEVDDWITEQTGK